MFKIDSSKISKKFLQYFESENHLIIEGASIIPQNDPTLLFINSGMAPMKKFFTGEEKPPKSRLCNIQPCIRTIDIDSVGDKHHLTSFQMLGNWGINDYFKKEAIFFAYKFVIEILKLDKKKLYVTVFSGDKKLGLKFDENSKKYWLQAGMPEDHIISCGKEDNFWGPTSNVGPCGPCTEIFYDTCDGDENKYFPAGNFDTKNRYIEIWNAGVFMQFNKNSDGSYSELSFTSVDAGAGLERMTMVINDLNDVYETDLLLPIKTQIMENLKKESFSYLTKSEIRILTDHIRTTAMILAERVNFSNEGRGYIPRKLLRKCLMILHKNKIKNFDFEKILVKIIENYSKFYPKFTVNKDFIINSFKNETVQFEKILHNGFEKLENIVKNSKIKVINGQEIFDLVTTYGLPFDIIKNFADENNFVLEQSEFNILLDKHKKISKKTENFNSPLYNEISELQNFPVTNFVGYENYNNNAEILAILKNEVYTESAEKNEKVAVILDKTCMFAESGGQSCDFGYIFNEEFKIKIDNVQKNKIDVIIHYGIVENGQINLLKKTQKNVQVEIDVNRRNNLAKNHSAAHLLHTALKKIFGQDVAQAGSKIDIDKFHFDFNYDDAVTAENIFEIEKTVNFYIMQNVPLDVQIKPLKVAISEGAVALFESKYTEKVRVVSFEKISKELCGGTHTSKTGNIGIFRVFSIENIGKGIKRITALTGLEALKFSQSKSLILDEIAKLLKVHPEHIVENVKKKLLNNINNEKIKETILESDIKLVNVNKNINCAIIIKEKSSKFYVKEINNIAEKFGGVALCIAGSDEKKQIIISICKNFEHKINAEKLLKQITNKFGGKGGGDERLASGTVQATANEIVENSQYFLTKL